MTARYVRWVHTSLSCPALALAPAGVSTKLLRSFALRVAGSYVEKGTQAMSIASFYFRVIKDEEDGLVYLSDFISCYQDLFESRDAFEQGDSVYLSVAIKDLPDEELKDLSQTLSERIFQHYFISENEYLAVLEKKKIADQRKTKEKPKKDFRKIDANRKDKVQLHLRVSDKVSDRLDMLCNKFGMNKKQLVSYLIMHQSDAGIFPAAEPEKKKAPVKQVDLSAELKKAQRILALGTFYESYKDASDYLNRIAYRVNRGEEVDQVAIREIVERYRQAESNLDALPYDSANKCMAKDVYESKMFQIIYNCMVTNPKNIIQLKDNCYNMEDVEVIDRSLSFNIYQKLNFGKEMTQDVSDQ